MKVQRIVSLIKRSYDQPLVFHRLHNHLTYVVQTSRAQVEGGDEWCRMLVQSAVRSKHPNQGLETKILGLLRSMRPPVESKGTRLRLWVILYYMKNRPCEQMNHLIVFELVKNFMGISPYTDGLILSVLGCSVIGSRFGVPRNKRLRDEGVVHLLSVVGKGQLGIVNRAQALPCYIDHDVEPPGLGDLDIQSDAVTLHALEHICFYAKFTRHVEFVKRIVPAGPVFVESLKRFISRTFSVEAREIEKINYMMEDMSVLESIRRAYEAAGDKEAFVSRVIKFVHELK